MVHLFPCNWVLMHCIPVQGITVHALYNIIVIEVLEVKVVYTIYPEGSYQCITVEKKLILVYTIFPNFDIFIPSKQDKAISNKRFLAVGFAFYYKIKVIRYKKGHHQNVQNYIFSKSLNNLKN